MDEMIARFTALLNRSGDWDWDGEGDNPAALEAEIRGQYADVTDEEDEDRRCKSCGDSDVFYCPCTTGMSRSGEVLF